MNEDVLSFSQVRVDNSLLNEVWGLDPRTLDQIDGATLSSYALALSQYLIYFTHQRNITRAEQHRLNKYIERSVSLILSGDEKKYKTKGAATDFIISNSELLMEAQTKLDNLHIELLQTEGMEKSVSELIATIKRELTRRENELYQVRVERRN
jgi:hypothetical protein